MPTMSRRAMRIVEVKIEGHSFIGGVFHLFRGRNAFETELHGLESGGSDGEEKRAFIQDLERCKERATTHAEKRRRRPIGCRFFYELIEFDNPASSSNL